MNTASKGRRQEHRSMAIYEKLGYVCVRSAGSRGVWDFIAISRYQVVLVQVRHGQWPGLKERARLGAFNSPLNVQREIHRWRPRARKPDVMTWNGSEWTAAA